MENNKYKILVNKLSNKPKHLLTKKEKEDLNYLLENKNLDEDKILEIWNFHNKNSIQTFFS